MAFLQISMAFRLVTKQDRLTHVMPLKFTIMLSLESNLENQTVINLYKNVNAGETNIKVK